ncbi:MAG: hypothetical protein IH946_07135, partial [Bacteroidetes bacterium]|nr:hypothetical protein [Bacteroidota bacterium]
AYFYDLNTKVNYVIDDRNRLFLSGYFGSDVWSFSNVFNTRWGNSTATLRWNHLFNNRLFSNFTAIYSDYEYQLGVPEGALAFEWTSHIINYNLKADLSYFANPNNTIDFGLHSLLYRFHPGDANG